MICGSICHMYGNLGLGFFEPNLSDRISDRVLGSCRKGLIFIDSTCNRLRFLAVVPVCAPLFE